MSERAAAEKLRIDILTIFPEYLEPLRHALLGKALEQGIVKVAVHDLRQWATGAHKSVDARPFGGGPGMVMKPEVWGPALDDVAAQSGPARGGDITSAVAHLNVPRHDDLLGIAQCPYPPERGDAEGSENSELPLLLVPTPSGKPFTQDDARNWSREQRLVFACGRYEGIDERVFVDARKRYRVREVSLGDYVLVGGEAAALVVVEAVTRLIPGVLGNQASHVEDSFSDGLLEGPCYTKPRQWRGLSVPEVLTSGDHAKIKQWRRHRALERTAALRPELVARAPIDESDRLYLEQLNKPKEVDPAQRAMVTDVHVLCSPSAIAKLRDRLSHQLAQKGVSLKSLDAEECASACEPSNILMDEAQLVSETVSTGDRVYRLEICVQSSLAEKEVTQQVIASLPSGTPWYGTTRLAQ